MDNKGKYIISEFYGIKPDAKLIKEAEETGKPIILSGILQKANTLNRNGRVYPYEILKREATKYMEAVEEGRALGECVPAGTEIFTKDGWRNIEDVEVGDDVFTLNIETGDLELQQTTDVIKKNYNDQMIHIYNGSNIDMMITKKHKVVLWDKNDVVYILTGEELYNEIKNESSLIFNSYFKNFEAKINLTQDFLKTDLVDFNDDVFCITVPNKTWMMRHCGKACWTHNCDHPDCQSADSQILTKDGWKYLPDISEDEEILTLNLENGKSELQKIDKKIDAPYKGIMYHITGKGVDIITTPNHRFLVQNKKGELQYITAENLTNINKKSHKLLRTMSWEGKEIENIIIDAIPEEDFYLRVRNDLVEKYSKDLIINAEWFFKFMGFYLSEGDCFRTKGGEGRGYQIQITQKDKDNVNKIREIINNLSPELIWKERVDENGTTRFTVRDARLHKYLFKLGCSNEKYIPVELKQASSHLLNMLFDTFLLGDGRTTIRNYYKECENNTRQAVFSTSKRLIEDLQEILLKTGRHGNITTYQPIDREIWDTKFIKKEVDNGDGTVCIEKVATKVKRIIKAENSKIQYFINVSIIDHINLERIKIEKIDFDDRVYCVRVSNGNFFTMRNGKCFWTGNSAVVSLANVSHKIVDMWWQGEELYGKVQILDTPIGDILKGLMKGGVMLGISSRGVGSVKSVRGEDLVQDDFELIAFDFVSSPSTPGAYLFKESKQWGLTLLNDKNTKILKPADCCNIEEYMDKYRKLCGLLNEDFWKKIS